MLLNTPPATVPGENLKTPRHLTQGRQVAMGDAGWRHTQTTPGQPATSYSGPRARFTSDKMGVTTPET